MCPSLSSSVSPSPGRVRTLEIVLDAGAAERFGWINRAVPDAELDDLVNAQRRLQVRFPSTIITHNPNQVFYFDSDSMLRRLDYRPEVTNAPIAHYVSEPRIFDGFVFPTRRQVFRHGPDGAADKEMAVITLMIDNVTIKRR